MKKGRTYGIIFIVSILVVYACTNPFAPRIADVTADVPVISDQTTVDGVFENFRYAYIFKDTVVYGNLLANDFTFIFTNYNNETFADESWGRDEDMITTAGLFHAAQSLDLIWNEVIVAAGDSLLKVLSRGYTLTIVFNPNDIITVQGRAKFTLKRDSTYLPWKIFEWRDESNY